MLRVMPSVFREFDSVGKPVRKKDSISEQCEMVVKFCDSFKLPDDKVNYSVYDEALAQKILSYREKALKPVLDMLKTSADEKSITAGLLLINRLIDKGVKDSDAIYPVVSKFDYTQSPNVQTMLSGVYRKILVPDAFGPLMVMFMKNSKSPTTKPFDPNTEVGGALYEYFKQAGINKDISKVVFDYLKNSGAQNTYSNVKNS